MEMLESKTDTAGSPRARVRLRAAQTTDDETHTHGTSTRSRFLDTKRKDRQQHLMETPCKCTHISPRHIRFRSPLSLILPPRPHRSLLCLASVLCRLLHLLSLISDVALPFTNLVCFCVLQAAFSLSLPPFSVPLSTSLYLLSPTLSLLSLSLPSLPLSPFFLVSALSRSGRQQGQGACPLTEGHSLQPGRNLAAEESV